MRHTFTFHFIVAIVVAHILPTLACADVVIGFANGDAFDNASAGASKTYTSGSESVKLNSVAIGGTPAKTFTAANALGVGANNILGDNVSFENGESWTFSFGSAVQFKKIEFDFTSQFSGEKFALTSDAFNALTIIGSLPTGVTYTDDVGSAGTFTFAALVAEQNEYDITSQKLMIAGGTSVKMTYSGGFLRYGTLTDMTVAVPEPSSFALAGVVAIGGFLASRRRLKRKLAEAEIAS